MKDRTCGRCQASVPTDRVHGRFVCDECSANPPLVEYECPDCGRLHEDAYYNKRCGSCRRKKHQPKHPCADCGEPVCAEATRCRVCACRHEFKLHERGEPFPVAKGYSMRFVPDTDPMAAMRSKNGHVLEHRLIMADHLGRPLAQGEHVHHRDLNPGNNALSNLQVLSPSAHTKLHAELRRQAKEATQ